MKAIIALLTLISSTYIYAEDIPRQKLDAFAATVSALVKAKNIDCILALYDWQTTPQMVIDINSQSWIDGITTGETADVSFIPLGDPRISEFHLRDITEGRTYNRTHYSPNLPVVGLLMARFTSDGKPGTTVFTPIGSTDSGQLKFAGIKSEKAK
jgi:hypothetical protein